jgi:hypothetical protein
MGIVLRGDMESLPRVQLFVSTFGDDSGPGTRSQPFRTLGHAMRTARQLEACRVGLKSDVYVKSGAYWIHVRLIPGAEQLGKEGRAA